MDKIITTFMFCLVFLAIGVGSVRANGIAIVSNTSNFQITQVQGTQQNITLTLADQETVDFVNVSFAPNPYVEMSPVSISSGSNVTVNATIIATQSFSGNIPIIGYYVSNLGQQNIVHNVSVDYTNGLSVCDFSAVQGDIVNWSSDVLSDVSLVNADTGQQVADILSNSSYSTTFSSPITFDYYFTRYGLQFTPTCTISVLSTTGYIHNPQFDANPYFSINITHLPTNLTVNIPIDTYTINVGDSTQDILTIRNNGNNTASNIHLDAGSWFNFTINDFDLAPGISKNIGYTIYPIISSSNQTNQNYNINLSISGNFDTYTHNFTIFIPYSLVTNNNTAQNPTLDQLASNAIQLALAYCHENPAFVSATGASCAQLFQAASNNANSTSSSLLEGLAKAIIDSIDSQSSFENAMKQYQANTTDTLNALQTNVSAIVSNLSASQNNSSATNETNQILAGAMIFGLVAFSLLYFIRRSKKKNLQNKFERFQ